MKTRGFNTLYSLRENSRLKVQTPIRGSLSCLRVYAARKRGLASIKSLVYTRVHTPTCALRIPSSIPDLAKRISYSFTRRATHLLKIFLTILAASFPISSAFPDIGTNRWETFLRERERERERKMRIKISHLGNGSVGNEFACSSLRPF